MKRIMPGRMSRRRRADFIGRLTSNASEINPAVRKADHSISAVLQSERGSIKVTMLTVGDVIEVLIAASPVNISDPRHVVFNKPLSELTGVDRVLLPYDRPMQLPQNANAPDGWDWIPVPEIVPGDRLNIYGKDYIVQLVTPRTAGMFELAFAEDAGRLFYASTDKVMRRRE
jgi:hypothetical protein